MILFEVTCGHESHNYLNRFGDGNLNGYGDGDGTGEDDQIRYIKLPMGAGLGANYKGDRNLGIPPMTFEHLVTNAALQITWRTR